MPTHSYAAPFRAFLPRAFLPSLLLASASALSAASSIFAYAGVNLAGADFGEGNLPGTYGTDYIYPTAAEVTYFRGKGLNLFRLPFRWERLQRSLGGALDATEFGRLDAVVAAIRSSGGTVLLDPHNYARYHGAIIGSSGLSNAQFADFWSKLATRYANDSAVIFGLMNEPNTMSTEQWLAGANAAIAAIRATGAKNLIFVPGNAWTGAHSWSQNWYGTANATVMLGVVDSENNYAYEVHQYVDGDYSGTNTDAVKNDDSTTGAQALSGFTTWLRANGKRGFLGEFATPRSALGLETCEKMLAHLDANNDVWLGYTWWAAGPWWGDYGFTLEPDNQGIDRPQLAVLAKHLPADRPGDLNGDRLVNADDLAVVLAHFGQTTSSPSWVAAADTNKSGSINADDFLPVLSNFGKKY